jgi:hypothetical protein
LYIPFASLHPCIYIPSDIIIAIHITFIFIFKLNREVMVRPNKRAAAGRRGGKISAALKRQKMISSQVGSEAEVLEESNTPSYGELTDGELTEEEDTYPVRLGQPEAGWEAAERVAYGYSKTRTYKQKTSYHKNKEEIKTRREEKKALSLGIPVNHGPKPVWGDISSFFSRGTSRTSEPEPIPAPTEPIPAPTEPIPAPTESVSAPPANWTAPTLMVQGDESNELSLVRPYVAPDFEDAFLRLQSFKNEARELERWLKGQEGKVTGDWLVRVECLRDLLQMQLQNDVTQAARKRDWIQYSVALARRINRSPRWASCLRQWQREWFEMRSPPPCPRQGRHVKTQSLFFDEGVSLAVREYLNTAMWHASPKGVCEAVSKQLQSENAAVDMMRIDAILCNSRTGRKSISEKTAIRWLTRLGWVYGRNKKGYCDGHERPDVIEYREKVFCPRLKVSCNL